MTHICARPECGNQVKRSTREYCSPDCAALVRRKTTRLPCPRCGKPTKLQRIFCSPACAHAANGDRLTKPPKACPRCNRPVLNKKRKYCSTNCSSAAVGEIISKLRRGVRVTRVARVARKQSDGPAPIRLRLREVYQWGFTLDLPADKRGDIDAVSRAMKRAEPAHPGFVLRTEGAGFACVREISGVRL